MKKNKSIIIIIAALAIAFGTAVLVLFNSDNENLSDNIADSDINNNQRASLNDQGEDSIRQRQGYFFEYNGVQIGINDEAAPILKALGEPMHYFEAPSCAFEGMDKIYSYSGFEFTTYTKDDKDYISSIIFLDDTVATREGIALNASLEEIVSIYGSEYDKSFEQYSYSDSNCTLSFILENGEVASVEYALVPENNQE